MDRALSPTGPPGKTERAVSGAESEVERGRGRRIIRLEYRNHGRSGQSLPDRGSVSVMQTSRNREQKNSIWPAMVADLNSLLRLKTTVIGMKMFATRGGDGGDPENQAADRGSHHRPDRQHGLAAGLDRRHHRRRSRRRAVPRGDRARAAGREMARRPGLCRGLAWHRRGRAQAPGGAGCRCLTANTRRWR